MVWDKRIPLGGEAVSSGDDRIRELKEDLETALRGDDTDGVEAKFPGADTASPVFRYRGLKGNTGARPAAGQYGLYFDVTRNVLQRDNGSSWDDIGTVIPAGTVMLFYQASAPVGFTQIVTQNDKALRVVSGVGGGTGGSQALSTTLAHTHTVASHTHSVSITSGAPSALVTGLQGGGSGEAGSNTHTHAVSGTSGGTAPATDSQLAALAYIDIILASKD